MVSYQFCNFVVKQHIFEPSWTNCQAERFDEWCQHITVTQGTSNIPKPILLLKYVMVDPWLYVFTFLVRQLKATAARRLEKAFYWQIVRKSLYF